MVFFRRRYPWTGLRKRHSGHYPHNIAVCHRLSNSRSKYQSRQRRRDLEGDIQRGGAYGKSSQGEVDGVQYYTRTVFICCGCGQSIFLGDAETVGLIRASASGGTEGKIRQAYFSGLLLKLSTRKWCREDARRVSKPPPISSSASHGLT